MQHSLLLKSLLALSLSLGAWGATISDVAWIDENSNAIRDAGDSPLGDVEVKLYLDKNLDGFPERLLERQTAAPDGSFSFSGLAPGDYSVGISLESLPERLYLPTQMNSGAEETDNDLEPNILRTDVISVAQTGQDITNAASIGFLPGSTNVTYHGLINYSGFAVGSLGVQPHDAWSYQDILFVALPNKGIDTEKATQWLKWYKRMDELYQQLLLLPNYQSRCRVSNTDGILNKRVLAMVQDSCGAGCGNGQKAEAVGIIDAASAEPDKFEHHWILYYEMARGLSAPWDARSVWPPRSVILPHMMGAMAFYEFGGEAGLAKTSVRGFSPSVLLEGQEKWDNLDVNYAETFADDINDQGVEFDGTRFYGGGIMMNFLLKIRFEVGVEKMAEILKNMSIKETASSSLHAAVNFTEAVNDATDGAYADYLVDSLGLPTPAEVDAFRFDDEGILRSEIGINFHAPVLTPEMEALEFHGVEEWTHTRGTLLHNNYVKGSDRSVFVSATANNTWQFGPSTNNTRDIFYHGYLDDLGNGASATISGLSEWMTKLGVSDYRLRIYRNTDSPGGFRDVDIRANGTLLDRVTYPAESIFTSDGGSRAFGDSQTLSEDTITITSPNINNARGPLAAIAIMAIEDTVGPLVLVGPTNGATRVSIEPTLEWEPDIRATNYVVRLFVGPTAIPIATEAVTGSTWTYPGRLDPEQLYRWVVVANNADTSWMSAEWSFTTTKDSDNDGLPDAWEFTHFGSISTQNGSSDTDGDGTIEQHEYFLEADPNDPTDRFWITIEKQPADNDYQIRMRSQEGITFSVQMTPSLHLPLTDWMTIQAKDDDGDPREEMTLPAPQLATNQRYFYRIEILSKEE